MGVTQGKAHEFLMYDLQQLFEDLVVCFPSDPLGCRLRPENDGATRRLNLKHIHPWLSQTSLRYERGTFRFAAAVAPPDQKLIT